MNLKKFISGVSAFAIAASAFAGMAVTANAEDVSLYSQNFESMTTDTMTGVTTPASNYATTNTIETDSTNYLKASGPSDRDRRANFTFDPVTSDSITGGKANITFRTKLATGNNAGTGNGRTGYSTIYVLPNGAATTFSNNAAPSEYLFAVQAKSKSSDSNKSTIELWQVLLLSGSDDVILNNNGVSDYGVTISKSSVATTNWITVSADVNFNTSKADIKINDHDAITVDLKSSKAGFIGFAFLAGAKNYGYATLDDVSITTADPNEISTADYTVKYVNASGTEIKDSVTRNGVVGDPASIVESDKAPVMYGNTKYIYASDDSSGKTIAANEVITVTFREAYTYDYTVSSNVGNYSVSGSGLEGNTITVPYPLYVNNNGTLYKKDAINSQFKHSFNLDEDEKNVSLQYDATDITNVVFYSEGEDIATLTPINLNHIDIRASKTYAGTAASDAVVTTLPAGYYKIYGQTACSANNAADVTVKLGDTVIASYNHPKASNTYNFDSGNDAVLITEDTDLTFASSNTTDVGLDYIYVVKTGDYVPTQNDMAFTLNKTISELAGKTITVHRTSDEKTAALSNLVADDGTVWSGEGEVKLAIIFTNIPAEWGTLSLTLD